MESLFAGNDANGGSLSATNNRLWIWRWVPRGIKRNQKEKKKWRDKKNERGVVVGVLEEKRNQKREKKMELKGNGREKMAGVWSVRRSEREWWSWVEAQKIGSATVENGSQV